MKSGRGLPDRREFLTLGVGALAVAGLPRLARRDRMVRRTIPVMGTVGEVVVRHRDGAWAQRAIDAALAELRRVDAGMSRFRPDSDVGRINAAAGGTVVVSEATAAVLRRALVWAAADGGFDPCLGRFTAGGDGAFPEEVPEAGGYARWLEVDTGGSVPRVRVHDPRAAVDLGAIAKGWAVDRAAEALRDHGVFHGLVNAGGDLAAMGVDGEEGPWRVGVRDPDDPDGIVTVVSVADASLATSGTYARGPHLLDPRTGRPRTGGRRSLTVRAPTCIDADAGATAVFGLDRRAAEAALIAAVPGAGIVHSLEGGTPWASA